VDIIGTSPTRSGRRFYRLADLPPEDYAPADYVKLYREYVPAYERRAKAQDRHSRNAGELKRVEAHFVEDAAAEAHAGNPCSRDPRPALRKRVEESEAEFELAEQLVVDISASISELRKTDDARDWWRGSTDAARDELLERAERQRGELEETLAQLAEVDWIALWAAGRKPSGVMLGVAELGRLEKLLRARADRRGARNLPRQSPCGGLQASPVGGASDREYPASASCLRRPSKG
jgi:hypothetical protein